MGRYRMNVCSGSSISSIARQYCTVQSIHALKRITKHSSFYCSHKLHLLWKASPIFSAYISHSLISSGPAPANTAPAHTLTCIVGRVGYMAQRWLQTVLYHVCTHSMDTILNKHCRTCKAAYISEYSVHKVYNARKAHNIRQQTISIYTHAYTYIHIP